MHRLHKRGTTRLYTSLAAIGLLMLFLWPSFVSAVPLTAKHELQRAWRYASDVGQYRYRSSMTRTQHPTLSLENVGRTAKVERASAQGSVDNPDETMQMTLWSVGIEQDGVDIKLEEGESYARRSGGEEWMAIEQPVTDLAPTGDPLGILLAADNIEELPDSARPAAADGLQAIVFSSTEAETGYRFDIDGVKYADHMRLQMQQSMRQQGELPASITLGPLAQYVKMEAFGEIWLDKNGLPVQQTITMKFAPERGADHWTEQQIVTGFSKWDTAMAAHKLYVLLPRLLEDPSLLLDPSALWPDLQYALSSTLFAFDERDMQRASMALGLLLLCAALCTLIITQRRSPRFYAVLSLTMVAALVGTPLLTTNQVNAYYGREESRQAAQEQQIAEEQQLDEMKSQQMGGDFDPHREPLAVSVNEIDPNAIAMAPASVRPATLPAAQQSALPSALPATLLDSHCTLAEGSDCDGDGLTDDVELYELGTDPEDVDTDGDNISDKTEVVGFTLNGTVWYLDPSNPDSNGDGTLDGVACPELVDVVQGVLGTPTGSICLNTDSDDTPDIFDFDDDADGVPDLSDNSRLVVAGPYNDTDQAFNFNLDLNQNGEPIFVDFEIRPTNADHLYYSRNVLDWPDNDTKGQWTKNTSTTLADLGEDATDDGDMILNPLLEIEITYDSSNPTAGLPVDDGFSASTTTIPDYSDLTWIDTNELSQWGISLNEGSTSNTMLLWIPLNVVAERLGDTPVAWRGRMQYVPQLSQTALGNDQRIRMIWMIQGVKDSCSPPANTDYDTYCADSANWTSSIDIMQTYYEDFYLTGLTVREDHGAKLHVIAEPSTVGNSNYEDYLWHLADQLQDTFIRGEQLSGDGRFDVDDIRTYAANWGLTGLDYTTSTLADHSDFAQLAEENLSILNRVFTSAAVGDRTTLMTAGEEVARVASLNDDAATVDSTSVSVDLTSVDEATGTVVRFSPFVYEGASVWVDDTLENYQNALAGDLATVFSNTQLDTLIAPSGETISEYDLVQDGAISLAQGFYLALYVGIGGTVEINDVSSNNNTVPDSGLALSGEPATNIVQHMLEEAQAFYAEKSVVTALAGASDSYAANALSAAFATSQLAFLEALGAVRQGDVTTSLTLALQELGDYYKVSDIDTTKFTDYASLSQQFYISGATGLSNSMGQDWSIAFYAAKVLSSISYVKWGLNIALGTAATIAKTASIFTKLWNSAKFWAVFGFIFTVGLALITFLTGDYDNQLEYNAAAVEFAFTVIVAFILALITIIPVVGFLIVGVLALIDALMALICAAVGVEPGSAVDTWVCNGITGAVIRSLSLLFSDQLVTVDLDKDDRLQVGFTTPEINPSSGTQGYVQGNQMTISAQVTNTLTLNKPKVGENLIILTSFTNSRLKEIMRESTFSYHLQPNKIDHSDSLELGDASRWSDNDDQIVFDVTGNGVFSRSGINQSTDLYLTESFNVAGLDCGGFIGASEATCNIYDVRDVAHSFVGAQFALDIFPDSLDGFYSLATVGSNNSYRLGWDSRFPALADADGDGLRSQARGGSDPDDNDPDFDDDGLSDFWEIDNGFDATLVDGDGDGLNDYWEAFYNTSPYLADTDNDGLNDGDEFFHSNARSAFVDDTSTWSGGWLFTYDFNGSTALKTRVSASPIDADTDGDNVTDRLEFVYGYNPKVPQEINVLSLVAATDSIVAPSASVAYTATVQNELNSRTARGLLEAEFPVDVTQEVQTFVLAQLEETMLTGAVTAPDLSATTELSVTIRAGAILEDPVAEDADPNLVAQYQFNENEPDTRCTGGFNNCSGSYGFADSSGNNIDAVCEKDFNGSYGVDCPVANGAFLEFFGVYNPNNSASYWTPVARIEPDNAFVLDNFSIEAWVKPDASQSHRQHILSKYGDITIGINPSSLQPFVEIQHSSCNDGDYDGRFTIDTTITSQIDSTINLSRGQWNQLVVTYNDNTNRLTFYINGESGGVITTTSCMGSGLNDRITLGAMDITAFTSLGTLDWIPPAFSSDSSSLIYGYPNAESFAFVGGLDRLQFYDNVLSITEIDDLYRNGNRVLDFTFDDPPGATTYTDTSGNELDGTCTTACPESGLPGLSNQAVYFEDSIIAVPATSDTLGLVNASYTIMAWLKGGDYSGPARYSALLGTVIGVVHDDATDDGYLALGNFASNQALVDDTPLDSTNWHHVAWRLEYDDTTPANSTRTIFVDGVQVAQDNGEASVVSFFTALPIGLFYTGWLDELLIVRNALSIGEIQSYMNEAPNLSLHLDEDLETTSFLDESQNQHSAICSGTSCPAAGADGWMREAPVFDGDDLLTVAADSALNVTDFSINLWVKPTNEKSQEQYLIRKSNSSGYNSSYSLSIEPNSLKVGFDIQSSCANANSGFKRISSNGELLENQWNSITATYNNDDNEMALYINGSLDSTLTSGASGICTSSQSVRIGETFEGNLDEIGVYGGTLFPLEVAAIYDYQSSWYDTVQQSPVIVDAEAPLVTPQIFSDLQLVPTIIAASAIDADSSLSNVASVSVTITPPAGGGSSYTASTSGNGNGDWIYTFSPTVEGEYTIEFAATDLVGNVGTASTVVNVDDTAPTITLDSNLTNTVFNVTPDSSGGPDTISLSGSVSDGGNPASGVVSNTVAIDVLDYQGFSLDAFALADTTSTGAASVDWSVEYPVVTPPYGIYTLLGRAEDVAGNVITQTVNTVAIDNLGPTADVMLGTVVVSPTNATISGTVMDVPFPGNSRELHLHFEEATAPFNDATLRQARATCDSTACPTGNASGQLGQAADFDGNDRLALVNIIDPSDIPFTAMTWLYADSSGAVQALLSQEDGTGTGRTWLGLTAAGNLYSELGGTQLTSTSALSTGSWVHVAVTYDGSDLTLYIDGQSDSSNTPTIEASDGGMVIGADKSAASNFDGRLDELAIYNRALSQDELYDIANPLSGGISEAQIRLRHFTGAPWLTVAPDDLKVYLQLDEEELDEEENSESFSNETVYANAASFTCSGGDCPTLGVDGQFDSAIYFDGTTEIEADNESFFDFEREVSISVWMKSADNASNFGASLAHIAGKEGAYSLVQDSNLGHVMFRTFHPVGSNPVGSTHGLSANFNIADGNWHHVIAIYDGAVKSIYIDGVLRASEDISSGYESRLGQFDTNFTLGVNPLASPRSYQGFLDEVAVFDGALDADDVQGLYTESAWKDVTLANSNSNFSTWTFALPSTMEGPYDIDLRVADSLGNSNTLPNVWIGNIDLVAPEATLTINQITDGLYETKCYAEDLNITDEGWVCPNDAELVGGLLDTNWFVDFFTTASSTLTRTVSYQTELVTYLGDGTESMTACDLVNNCTTITSTVSIVDEITTILTPTENITVTTLDAISISGFSRALDELASLEVTANGETIYSTTWGDGSSESTWSFDWTPSAGGIYLISATTTDDDGDTITSDSDLTITVVLPDLMLTKSVTQPDILNTGDQITYTIVLANGGLAIATNIMVTDTLPSGVSPVNASDANFSATVDLAAGESVTYTIPVIVTASLGEEVVNTAYYSYGSVSGSSGVTIQVCTSDIVVTNGNNSGDGSLRAAVEALCSGSTITFSNDMTVQLSGSLEINRSMTIDGSGFDVTIDGGFQGSRTLSIASDSGPVTLEEITFTNGGAEAGQLITIGGSNTVTISNSTLTYNESFFGPMLSSTTDLQIMDSTISYNGGDAILRIDAGGSLTMQNSSVYGNQGSFIQNNGGTVNVDFSTLVQNNGGLENVSGQMSASNSILGGNDSFDCDGTVIDGGYNLVSNSGGCATDSGTTTAFDDATLLTALIEEPTTDDEVIVLLNGSPALDAIPDGTNGCGTEVTTDQRGVSRPQGSNCDIGAYEEQVDLRSEMSESLGSYSYNPTATTYGALGELTIDFEFVNIGSQTLQSLLLLITTANNAVVVNTDQGVGGDGSTMTIANSDLPGGDGQFAPDEKLMVQFVIAIEEAPWGVNFEMYGTEAGAVNVRSSRGLRSAFSVHSTLFDDSLFPIPDGQSSAIFFPFISGQAVDNSGQRLQAAALTSEEVTHQILLPVLVNQ